ncbi:hypothetical protein CALCODRAFT_495059 [Calocera cornea HHB12733]|uniref:Uncharacterized protein n=1 Tax=Calocera cornea HHB12733 TaxID=1353952 RepID=A0A165GPZ0_9BASI|nr:hypothetical protein CALCODRAFT_495059 [Calocera cornea HHB12733]
MRRCEKKETRVPFDHVRLGNAYDENDHPCLCVMGILTMLLLSVNCCLCDGEHQARHGLTSSTSVRTSSDLRYTRGEHPQRLRTRTISFRGWERVLRQEYLSRRGSTLLSRSSSLYRSLFLVAGYTHGDEADRLFMSYMSLPGLHLGLP